MASFISGFKKDLPPNLNERPLAADDVVASGFIIDDVGEEPFAGEILEEAVDDGVSLLRVVGDEVISFRFGESNEDLSNELCKRLDDFFNGGRAFFIAPADFALPRGGRGP